jgi:hypothetical protein
MRQCPHWEGLGDTEPDHGSRHGQWNVLFKEPARSKRISRNTHPSEKVFASAFPRAGYRNETRLDPEALIFSRMRSI